MKKSPVVITAGIFAAAAVILAVFLLKPEKKKVITAGNALVKCAPFQYGFFSDTRRFDDIEKAARQSLLYYKRVPDNRTFVFGKDTYSKQTMIASLERFAAFVKTSPAPDELNAFVRRHYRVYRTAREDSEQVLFTGYFEPTFKGRLEQSTTYRCPLYSVPDDLVTVAISLFSEECERRPRLFGRITPDNTVIPYYTREEINQIKDFEKRASPVVWLKNRLDRLFLEIQGSGRIVLENGKTIRVHYAAKNGHAYRSIGKYLIEKEDMPKHKVSMQSIRRWLKNNPEKMDAVLHHNPSFVFFKQETGGPYGCLGVPVTPMRSIATDSRLFPKGALCFIRTSIPVPGAETGSAEAKPGRSGTLKPFSGFVFNQDTGGAIKGPSRADLFFGNGKKAAFGAGRMKYPGELYFLVLKKP